MSNPMTEARTELGAALVGIGVPVHLVPPGATSGACVHVVAGEVSPRGHVNLEVTISAPLVGPSVDLVEQLAWDVREAVAAAGMGWLPISAPQVDTEAQRLLRTITVTTRP